MRHIGWYIDFLVVESNLKDGSHKYKEERIKFSYRQKKEYLNFLKENENMVVRHGERYS